MVNPDESKESGVRNELVALCRSDLGDKRSCAALELVVVPRVRDLGDHEERAIYPVEGEVEIAGDHFEAPRLLIFCPGDRITVRATRRARLMFLGGSALEGPRHIWWNFGSSRRERIEQAKEDWKSGRFAPVPAETEFIPLPES